MACEDSIELYLCSVLWARTGLGLVVYESVTIPAGFLNLQKVLKEGLVVKLDLGQGTIPISGVYV